MQEFLLKPSQGPERHRMKSDGPSIKTGQYLSSTAQSSAANVQYIVIAPSGPGVYPAHLVKGSAETRPGLNFGPGRAAGVDLCNSSGGVGNSRKEVDQ